MRLVAFYTFNSNVIDCVYNQRNLCQLLPLVITNSLCKGPANLLIRFKT